MESLRRLLSILLLTVFALPLVLPLLAMGQDADAGLPACCRRNGKHHCRMALDGSSKLLVSRDPQFRAPADKCPYMPGSVAPAQPNPLAEPSRTATVIADALGHPMGVAQTAAGGRISLTRSHQKRGPPALHLL